MYEKGYVRRQRWCKACRGRKAKKADGSFSYPAKPRIHTSESAFFEDVANVPRLKACTRCTKYKAADKFRQLKNRTHPYCRECEKTYNRERRVRKQEVAK